MDVSLQARIEKAKKDREKENEDALSWVTKSRKLEEERKNKRKQKNFKSDREKAKKASDLLDQYENQVSEDYDGFELKGIKVAHDIKDFNEDQSIILTLKDSYILNDKNELNDEEDILENLNMSEVDKWKLAKEATKKGYNVHEEIEIGDTTDVLKKYDELKSKEGFRLAGAVTSSLSKEEKLEQIRKKLGASVKSLNNNNNNNNNNKQIQYSLENTSQPVNEYLPQTFKKKRRRKKKKSRKQISSNEILQEQQNINNNNNNNNESIISTDILMKDQDNEEDHGSRILSKEKKYVNVENIKKQTKIKAYEKAIEKAKIESLTLLDEEAVTNEDDNEIYETLRKIRKVNPKKENLSTSSIVSQVKNRKLRRVDVTTEKPNKIIFTNTSEFCRNINPITKEEENRKRVEPAHKITKQEKDKFELDNDPMILDNQNINDINDKDRVTLEEDELLTSKGIMATLNLLKQTGNIEVVKTDSYAGRRADAKIQADPDDPAPEINLNQYDEFGRVLTTRERFRQLSYSFHGEGPGLNKLEKEQKKHKAELRAHGMLVDDSIESVDEILKQEQERTGNAHIELSAPATPSTNLTKQHALIRPQSKEYKATSANIKGDKIEFGFTGTKRQFQSSDSPASKKQKYK